MKTAALILTTALLASAAPSSAGPQNGFYAASTGAFATPVKTQGGRPARLGKRRTLKILETQMRSDNNENTSFQLSVTIPYDPRLEPDSYVLVVDGHAYRQNGSGASQNESSSLSFSLAGNDHAKRVARYLGTTIGYRRHPGHHLLVSFVPERPEFEPGADVFATLRVTNVGANAVAFMQGGRNRAVRDNQYVFEARYRGKQVEDIGTSYHFGGLAQRRLLGPGDTFEDRIDLKKWFAFGQPGTYEIHGAYYLDFMDPAGGSWTTVWEDYVSADFIVQIKGT